MSQLALDLGVPSTLVTEAVYARCLSALKEARVPREQGAQGPRDEVHRRQAKRSSKVRHALYASKICSYAQGYVQLQAAAKEHNWPLNFGNIALLWRGGCIIRARFLDRIKEAFDAEPNLENLLLAPYFLDAVEKAQNAWRHVVSTAVRRRAGAGVHGGVGGLAYYDGLYRQGGRANACRRTC
jgi:6-phosphogluconate dehydrogenase